MRLFAALRPPEQVLSELATEVGALKKLRTPAGERVRWAQRTNWHVTLAFYGDVSEELLPELQRRLERVAAPRRPIELRLAGGGQFGGRTLWAGVATATRQETQALRTLANAASAAGRRAGLELAERARFHPHLTLARARYGKGARRDEAGADLAPYVAALERFRSAAWAADELELIRSNLPASGVPGEQPRYERLRGWRLAG